MPTRRERIRTSFSSIPGLWTWVITGFLGSSKIRAFIPLSQNALGRLGHSFNLAARGRCEDGLEQRDVVDQLRGGDRIDLGAADGAGEAHQIVLSRLSPARPRRAA